MLTYGKRALLTSNLNYLPQKCSGWQTKEGCKAWKLVGPSIIVDIQKTLINDRSEKYHTAKQLKYSKILAAQQGDVKIKNKCSPGETGWSRATVFEYVLAMEPSPLVSSYLVSQYVEHK